MHFATRVRTWRVARLYSAIALSRKPFGIGHMYIYTYLLRMTDTMTFQNIDLSLYIYFLILEDEQQKPKATEHATGMTKQNFPHKYRPTKKSFKTFPISVNDLCLLLWCFFYVNIAILMELA
jgi:hypothetical protein